MGSTQISRIAFYPWTFVHFSFILRVTRSTFGKCLPIQFSDIIRIWLFTFVKCPPRIFSSFLNIFWYFACLPDILLACLVWYVSNILPLWMVCTTFDESFWVVSRIYNTTRNIHMIARFTIQLMGNNSKKQSPAPPTSNILKQYWANRDCNCICLDYFPE